MLGDVEVRAREHEDPLCPVRERRPDLLARDHPLVTLEHGPRLHVGEVGAGVGLGVSLAPDLRPVEDAGQHRELLGVGAEMDDGRAEQALADDADASGAAGARVLLVEDHLLDERRAAAAVLGGPPEPDPTVAAEFLLPLPALVEALVLVARTAAAPHRCEGPAEAAGQPRLRVGAEALLFGGEAQVQVAGRYQTPLVHSARWTLGELRS